MGSHEGEESLPLRERKQLRTREAIIEAAMTLFAERGFDSVTVSDIAARAEVGRTTFFRYFIDKPEVLFADDEKMMRALTETVDAAARKVAPIGDSLATALDVARTGLFALGALAVLRAEWLPLRDHLIRENPALQGRQLLKERRYGQAAVELLVRHGATAQTATLAVGIAAACYAAAQESSADNPDRLVSEVDSAFERMAELDVGVLRSRLFASGWRPARS